LLSDAIQHLNKGSTTMLKSVLCLSLFAASVAACSSNGNSGGGSEGGAPHSATLKGHIVNGTGSDATDFGGAGAVDSSKTVSAGTVTTDGTTTSLAMGPLAADGTYSLDVPVHDGPTMVEALDAKGAVVVRALLEDTLVAGNTMVVQPMTTESSVEAAVLLEMTAMGTSVADVDLVGLRARIDAATASVVDAHATDNASSATADVHALAVAALAAQLSQQASLKAAKVDWTSYAAAELSAADALTVALNASSTGTAKANADFTAKLATLDGKFGLDAASAASDATNATTSALETIAAMSSSTDLIDAFDHTEAMIDGAATVAAVTESFTNANASATVMANLQTADTALVTQVDAAGTAAAVTSAFDTWRTAVRGTATGTGGLLATALGGTLTGTADYAITIGSLVTLDTALQTTLDGSAAASETKGTVDATKLAQLVAQAYAKLDTSITTTLKASTVAFSTTDSALTSSVFVASDTTF
jgi:hypothetical protein